eukprot:scaffold6123_cov113-Isochrysis_galbana.AAC.3
MLLRVLTQCLPHLREENVPAIIAEVFLDIPIAARASQGAADEFSYRAIGGSGQCPPRRQLRDSTV